VTSGLSAVPVKDTTDDGVYLSQTQTNRPRVFWPFFVGTDNPISYLYQKIAPYVSADGFNITVLSAGENGLTASDNVSVIPSGNFDTWRGRATLGRLALKRYDLLHTGGITLLHYPVSLLNRARNREIAHVHTYRIDVDPESDRTPTWVRRRLGQSAAVTTAVSEHTAATVQSTFGFEPEVIYNAVDTDLFRPGYERPTEFDNHAPDRPVFLYVGTFERRKRPLDVLRVARRVPEAAFVFVGGGGSQSRDTVVRERIEAVENGHYLGRVPKHRLPSLYSNTEALVFPSTMEGCPNVVLESFACGTPVVGYRATSMPELVEDGERGFLAAVGDVDGLVEGVRAVRRREDDALGANARSYVHRNHTFDAIAAKYARVYRQTLSA